MLNRAYVFSVNAHGTQKRASGDPYFSHPIEVAGILTELDLDDETIATAILHDTVEDTAATLDRGVTGNPHGQKLGNRHSHRSAEVQPTALLARPVGGEGHTLEQC